ncbi:hypothetical protein RB200_39975 [Streptomyces sp. PmtG]
MIQIQAALFWAYAVGATFALAAGRQLQVWERINAGEGPRTRSRAANPYLALTLLFAAVLMVPTGLFVLWQNPSWATMHVAGGHDGVWAGFVLLYAGGIPVAALLGFLAAQVLVLVGAGYWAYLNCVGGYFAAVRHARARLGRQRVRAVPVAGGARLGGLAARQRGEQRPGLPDVRHVPRAARLRRGRHRHHADHGDRLAP